ncbi:MAG: hypothetical protein F6J90_28555 [Moorea sp. SIOASIH]|uniref:hypothetical protein n=1 Tax=Moorena sp. SIOASIH TaxID=2607817 RepID=UPI0013BB0A55|nr:hypothetical protein [Moorena sp. SIOASIH]NEO40075.1 hypothetical protein [Moorena sp. SIOASIH]
MRYKFLGFREQGTGNGEQGRENREDSKNPVYLIRLKTAISAYPTPNRLGRTTFNLQPNKPATQQTFNPTNLQSNKPSTQQTFNPTNLQPNKPSTQQTFNPTNLQPSTFNLQPNKPATQQTFK